ncbi:MAG: restriction endonuclease subunit S [Spartobacteria bacterium]
MKPGYKQTEVGVIPEDWEVAPVRQKGEVVTGKALAVNAPGPQRPYLRTKNVFDGRIDIDDVLTMPMTDEQFEQFRIRNGDVLLNEGQSIELVGRCAMSQDEYLEPCAIQNALLRFRARAGVSEMFASYLFRHCQHTGVFARIALQTTSVAHLGGSRFERLRLAWPTEPEQRAIAEALSDVDGLLGGLDRLIAKKRDLKQAAMQQLLTGQTRLPGFHGEWEVKRLGDMATFYKGKGLPKSALCESGAEPCIHYGELFTRYPETIGEIFSRTDTSAGVFRSVANDVLMPTSDVTPRGLAKASCVRVDGVILGGDILVIRSDTNIIHGSFLSLVIRYEETQVLQLVTGSTVYHLYGSDMKNFTFSMPSVPEQTAIAQILSDMDAELTALEQRREKTRALKQAMMQELLTGRTRLV